MFECEQIFLRSNFLLCVSVSVFMLLLAYSTHISKFQAISYTMFRFIFLSLICVIPIEPANLIFGGISTNDKYHRLAYETSCRMIKNMRHSRTYKDSWLRTQRKGERKKTRNSQLEAFASHFFVVAIRADEFILPQFSVVVSKFSFSLQLQFSRCGTH